MGNTLKQMLVLAALVAAPITMNAQIGEGKAVPGDATWQSIPKAFTSDGKSYLTAVMILLTTMTTIRAHIPSITMN